MQPVYVFKAAGVRALNFITGAFLLLETVIVVVLLIVGVLMWVALAFFAGFLPAALIWLLLPRRFEVERDRLVIVFPVLVRWSLGFDTIESAEVAKWWHAYAFMGVRLASSPGKSVDIMRCEPNIIRRPNIVISPEDRELFIERLSQALARYRPR